MSNSNGQPEHVTTQAITQIYQASEPIFSGLLLEVRELSKKKPEATMSASKIKIINRVLSDLLLFLNDQPEAKYLDKLDDQTLPQVSDALLVMVQFKTALSAFAKRHTAYDSLRHKSYWVTAEHLQDKAN